MFQHTAARRRLEVQEFFMAFHRTVSTHSRPKAAGMPSKHIQDKTWVSTHSRPKAAGMGAGHLAEEPFSFNTQPPEGGWRQPWRSKAYLI